MENPQWFHLIVSTYGAWLPGDPRGFRTRHHREHVEGDYKNPPPKGKYDDRLRQSRKLLTQAPVVLAREWRPILGVAMRDRLRDHDALLVCLSVSGQHVHALAQMPVHAPRDVIGIAKKHGWFVLRERGWVGKLWGKRCKVLPIRDRAHQLNVFHYIKKHALQGAWFWSMLDDKVRTP